MIRLYAISERIIAQPKTMAAKKAYASQLATTANGFITARNSSSMRAI